MTSSHYRRLSALEKKAQGITDPLEQLQHTVVAGMWARLYFNWMCDGDNGLPRPALHEGQTLRQWEAASLGLMEDDWNFLREHLPKDGDFDMLLQEIEVSLKANYRPADLAYFDWKLREGWRKETDQK
jgi:hypothetical protein